MPSRRIRALLLLTSLAAALTAAPAFAAKDQDKDDAAFAAGLKFGLEKSVGKLAELGYKTNCKAKNLDYKSDDSWYCGVFAKLSGQDEAEHKERVMHHLEKIRADLVKIQEALEGISERQNQLYSQNERLLLRLDEIGPETNVGRNLSHIRTVFREQYAPLFAGERDFTDERLRNFAHQIVFVDKIHDRLGSINDQLTVSQVAGKEPLLRAYAKSLTARMRSVKSSDLDAAYQYLESVVDGLLADERSGYVMYVWATETLQTDCEVATAQKAPDADARCKDFKAFPHTANEYRAVFAKHIQAQLNELNAGTEYTVLAMSDPHSRNANFLAADGARVLARCDLFTAANLGEASVIRGRVISMGEAYDGAINLDGKSVTPGFTAKVQTDGGRIDWWRASSAHAYDEVQFSDRWKIYHYAIPVTRTGAFTIATDLPYKPAINVEERDLGGSKITFGSFTAIQRAGGGYAFLSGGWHPEQDRGTDKGAGVHNKTKDDLIYDANVPKAGVFFAGTIEWRVLDSGQDQHIEAKRSSYAVSNKKVRMPQEAEVTLTGVFGDSYRDICGPADCGDVGHNEIISRFVKFTKGGINSREAKVRTRAVVLVDNEPTGSNGIVWDPSASTDKNIFDRYEAAKESKRIRLDKTPRSVIFGGMIDLNLQTSGIGESQWRIWALPMIENAYISE